MSALSKLLEAKVILEKLFDKEINSLDLNQDSRKLHIFLTDGIEIYIIYNNHGQYGYNILFSNLDLDRFIRRFCEEINNDYLFENFFFISSREPYLSFLKR
ncbi:MAG: hypothetical protein EU550_01455 [Promethearchaeota archaeon]|nr:MAG: hypothetical protein EU550_01455 [Candidatus Lokiarchaeota archaeon]